MLYTRPAPSNRCMARASASVVDASVPLSACTCLVSSTQMIPVPVAGGTHREYLSKAGQAGGRGA
jgi:hypothetical protein